MHYEVLAGDFLDYQIDSSGVYKAKKKNNKFVSRSSYSRSKNLNAKSAEVKF